MRTGRCALFGIVLTALCAAAVRAADAQVNPCQKAVVQCRAGDSFLDVVYVLELQNPTGRPAALQLLPPVDVLQGVEGVRGDLVLSRAQGGLRASVPAGWKGRIILRAKQRITRRAATGASAAAVPLPPALSREVEFEAPSPRIELIATPECIVEPLGAQADRSEFRLLPLRGETLALEWRQLPPARRAAYALHQVHRITENAPEFNDEVALDLIFADARPDVVVLDLPPGASVTEIKAPGRALWAVREGRIEVTVLPGLAEKSLSLTCRIEGSTVPAEDGAAQLLRVPLFTSPEAERHTGRVLVSGSAHELDFAVLKDAARAAAGDEEWRLACDLRGPAAEVVVSIVPIEAPVQAAVESFYRVSAFNVAGEHRVSIGDRLPSIPSLEVILPPGHVARTVSCPFAINWSQDGRRVRVKPLAPVSGGMSAYMTTEWLTGGEAKVELSPPLVPGVVSAEYALGVAPSGDIQLKTAGAAETWRVPPESLPPWLRGKGPTIAYRYPDTVVPVEAEVARLRAEIRGEIQEHATVLADRIRRESLFLLEVSRRPVDELVLDLAPGLTVERVGGPGIEGWDVSEDGSQLTVRFASPVSGACHFSLVASEPAEIGHVKLRGIQLRDAPQLKGWLGISWDVSVDVRPFEDGRLNLGSVRTELAPAYLKGFENRLLYEFYDSRWELDLITDAVPPVYTAEVLNVVRFRAAQADASALFNIHVTQGGATELDFELPPNATSPQLEAPDLVLSQLRARNWHIRLRGKHSGTLSCRIDYSIVAGMGESELAIEPVRLLGAREQTGVLLLTQARPDAGVKVGTPPRQLQPAEPEARYSAWDYEAAEPAVAAFTYRGADWTLPLVLTSHSLSEVMLSASIPLAKLDTLMQSGDESIHHLRLYVSNTSKQFLTLDLEKLGPGARLIGAYVYGEPVKPFREGKTKLQLPLFTSEKAARTGMCVLDITYATPHRGLTPLRKQSLVPPELGLNVGQLEWTVRVPDGCRLAAVGGNMGEPVSEGALAPSLAGRLVAAVRRLLERYGVWIIGLAGAVMAIGGLASLAALLARRGLLRKALRPAAAVVLVVLIIAVLAAMLMPALATAREQASRGGAPAAPTAAAEPSAQAVAKKEFAGTGLAAGELKQAFELEQQMAPEALRFGVRSREARSELVDRSLVEARRSEIDKAVRRYKDEHGGEAPASGQDLAGYIADRELLDAIENSGVLKPIMAVEGGARPPDRWQRLEVLGEALTRYTAEHGGDYPGTLDALSGGGYLPDPSVLQSSDAELRYSIPKSDDAYEVVAYYWPTEEGPNPVLSQDGRVRLLQTDKSGRVRHPLTRQMTDLQQSVIADAIQAGQPLEDKDQLAQARYNLGVAYLDRGRYEEAEDNFRRALDLKPDYEQAQRQLAQTGALRGATAAFGKGVTVSAGGAFEGLPETLSVGPPPGLSAATDLVQLGERLATQEELARRAGPGPTAGGRVVRATEAVVAVPVPQEVPRRAGKASLVTQLGGGRSVGALPIAIEFPVPQTADYQFVKPFLGRADAELSFRTLSRQAAMLIELALAALALVAYVAIRSRRPSSAMPFGGAVLVAALLFLLAGSASVATLFASTALAMAACLAGEMLRLSFQKIRKLKAKES